MDRITSKLQFNTIPTYYYCYNFPVKYLHKYILHTNFFRFLAKNCENCEKKINDGWSNIIQQFTVVIMMNNMDF